MFSIRHLLAVAAALVVSTQAAAEAYRARDVGNWIVAASEDDSGCFLTRQYDGVGKTTLLLGLDIDGTNHLSVLNDNWSIKPRQRLTLNYRLSNGGYTDHVSIGMASDGKRGFVTTFETKFLGYFATSEALQISNGDVPVEELGLAGSGAAVAELRRCVATRRVGGAAAASERERPRAIPKDPFAQRAKP